MCYLNILFFILGVYSVSVLEYGESFEMCGFGGICEVCWVYLVGYVWLWKKGFMIVFI